MWPSLDSRWKEVTDFFIFFLCFFCRLFSFFFFKGEPEDEDDEDEPDNAPLIPLLDSSVSAEAARDPLLLLVQLQSQIQALTARIEALEKKRA